jgi:hypothetical protein
MSIHQSGPVAYLTQSKSAVYFSPSPSSDKKGKGTPLPIRRLLNVMNIAYWGEDNRFPQHIEQQMAYCGVGKFGLDWKARMLYGNGIVPGKITGQKDDGTEIFTALDRTQFKEQYAFIEDRRMYRFWLEYMQDWTWFSNNFPEIILSKDGKKITGLVHQESCDARYMQMDDEGNIPTVFLSKLWGASSDQFAKFDPTKTMLGLQLNPNTPDLIDNKFIKQLHCIDMYDPVDSLKSIAETLKSNTGLKSAILPVNYPSVNKTYYQVPAWDGARLAGWVEIASKIPSMLKALYTKAFTIKYHIEVPDTFFSDKYGDTTWDGMDEDKRAAAKKALLQEMDDALSGGENAYKSFITFYKIGSQDKKEYGNIKITAVEDKVALDKEFITQSAADIQTLVAMGIDPTLIGAGTIGTGQQRSGGSDKRESYLIYCAGLNLERQVLLEPLYLVRDYNQWDPDIVFRFRDTILTTLDTGAGTKKTLS